MDPLLPHLDHSSPYIHPVNTAVKSSAATNYLVFHKQTCILILLSLTQHDVDDYIIITQPFHWVSLFDLYILYSRTMIQSSSFLAD